MPANRQLFVLRHAKSSWEDPGLDDCDRPLAPRGRKAVAVLADHIREHGIRPAQVLCSSARRTRETLDGIAPGGEVLIEPDLYSASVSDVLERLKTVPEDADSVMVIGHNPAMQMLVLRLAGANHVTHDDPNLETVRRKFSTGALATLSFDCGWHDLGPGQAKLTALVRPKDLH